MTSTRALTPRPLAGTLALLTALVASALLLAPGARPGGGASIVACSGSAPPPAACVSVTTVPSSSGVYFMVTTGGGNRDFASVGVGCDNGYATVLNVEVPAKGTGTSQVVYPPAGLCTASLEKQMSIGKAHVLGTVSFTVT
jgi:hypothetical protein